MKKTLIEKFKEIEAIIDEKETKVIEMWLKHKNIPEIIFEIAGYRCIREKKVTGIGVNRYKACGRFKPSYKKRPTRKDVEAIVKYNELYSPSEDHVGFDYIYSDGGTSRISGFDNLSEILNDNRRSFNKDDLIPELKRVKELYEPREGYIKCEYCSKQRLPQDIHQKTIISRMYTNCESGLRNYCKDSPCASHDQMGHEG